MESERALQGYLFRRAKKHGIYCRKMRAEGQTGFPDVLLAHDGIVMFVELKSPTGKGRLSARQKRELQRLRDAGLSAVVVYDTAGVDLVIQSFTG